MKGMSGIARTLAVTALGLAAAAPAMAQNVKVTALGGVDGEFCRYDRAMIFEDPNGTRVLYDAGRTVAGAEDARLGNIDVVLLSHAHGDHLGDRHIPAVGAGSCAEPDMSVVDAPSANTVNIAVAKGATIVTGSEMPEFLAGKMKAAGGDPKKSVLVRFGGSREVGGVTFTTVPAVHSNGLSPAFLSGQLAEDMKAAGINAYVGPPTGYVVTFSNGLVVYLSGDTGVTAEQKSVVGDYYHAKLVVMNIGDTFTTGPAEAAYVIDDMIKPASVIPSHANEEATKDGKVIDGTRTAAFIAATKVPVYVPLSGHEMEFDGSGACVSGC